MAPEKKPFFVKPDRYLWLLGGIAFCGMLTENTMFDWSVNYFEKTMAAEKGMVTLGLICFIITMTVGRLVGDWFVHRFGHLNMLIINGILMAVGFALASALPFLLPASLGFLLIGIGDSIIVPIVYMMAARSTKMPAPYAITAVTIIGYAGFLVAPVLIGGISQWLGMQWALAIVAVFSFGISVLSPAVKKRVEQIP